MVLTTACNCKVLALFFLFVAFTYVPNAHECWLKNQKLRKKPKDELVSAALELGKWRHSMEVQCERKMDILTWIKLFQTGLCTQ